MMGIRFQTLGNALAAICLSYRVRMLWDWRKAVGRWFGGYDESQGHGSYRLSTEVDIELESAEQGILDI